jgi:hypothetical protein
MRLFGPNGNQVTSEWRRLHNEELHNLHSSTSIIRMIKSRKIRWVGNVARMGKIKISCRVLVGKTKGNIEGDSKKMDSIS